MQKPFAITDEMLREIDEQVEHAVGTDLKQSSQPRLPLLEARETTHGSFEDNANISQALKQIMRVGPGWGKLTNVEKEAMDMIALKFSRILSGRSLEKQHWEDVVGYAKLVELKCS